MPLTINSSATSYATVTQFLNRYDVRSVGDLLSDNNVRMSSAQVASSPALADLLMGASGQVELACLAGQRYGPTDLVALASSATNGASLLANLVCDLAFYSLLSRRPMVNIETPKRVTEAFETIQLLRGGERVFPFEEAEFAGVDVEVVLPPCPLSCQVARLLGPCNVCCPGTNQSGCGGTGGCGGCGCD